MYLHIVLLVSTIFPFSFSYDKYANFRTRRTLQQSNQPKKLPFVIRVPFSKIVPTSPLFSHSVAWKAKQPASKSSDEPQPDVEVSQFHTQDTNGQVVFGFNSPDQMRIESRNADGTVHGTYSYLDPYGQIIKRQYWDTGAGFHVTSNSYPLTSVGQQSSPYTPEVQAARDLHFQLYQQALAALLPNHGTSQESQNNTAESSTSKPAGEDKLSNDTEPTESVPTTSQDSENDGVNTLEPNSENGTIVIQNPEYLRISWTTENKKYRINLYNETSSSVKNGTKHEPGVVNITKFTIQGSK